MVGERLRPIEHREIGKERPDGVPCRRYRDRLCCEPGSRGFRGGFRSVSLIFDGAEKRGKLLVPGGRPPGGYPGLPGEEIEIAAACDR